MTIDKSNEIAKMDGKSNKGRRKREGRYEQNPFLLPVRIRRGIKIYPAKNKALINVDTGEIDEKSLAGFATWKEVDEAKFIKLYVNGVKALKELTSAGAKVFEVLYYTLQNAISKDQVYISFGRVNQKITPMSESTYNRGIRELISEEFLAPSLDAYIYWINPDFIFNGDRLDFMESFYKKGSAAALAHRKRMEEEERRQRQAVLPFKEPEPEALPERIEENAE